MKRFLVRLYPQAWRDRYGEEFLDLLAQRPLGPADVLDIVLSAIDARRRGRPGWRRGTTSGRRWGLVAMAGGILYPLALLLAIVDTSGRPWRVPDILGIDGMAWPVGAALVLGAGLLVISMAALGAAAARRHSALAWLAVGIGAVTCLGIAVTLAVMAAFPAFEPAGGPYYRYQFTVARQSWALAVVFTPISTLLFAFALLRTHGEDRAGARLLLAASGIPVASWFHQVAFDPPWIHDAWWVAAYFFGIALSGVSWVRLGWAADHPRLPMQGPREPTIEPATAD